MNDRFQIPSFESAGFLNESILALKIKPGESSSSDILNRYLEALASDQAIQTTRVDFLATRISRVLSIARVQSASLLAAYQSVALRVDAASGYSQILCDMFSQTYVDTGSTDCQIEYNFGQATLPVRSSSDLITFDDVYGNVTISPETEISYSINSSNTLDFLIDPDARFMLTGQQTWLLPSAANNAIVYTKLKAPLQYRGLSPNVLELWPIPAFGTTLQEVAYQLAGDSFTSNWVALDLSYLPNYNSSTGYVDQFGPVRIHLPNLPLSQIRITQKINVTVPLISSTPWGWHRIKVLHTEYEDSAVLTVKDPYSRTISDPVIRGKDPASLSLLSTNINGSNLSITLATQNTSETPVITGVILSV